MYEIYSKPNCVFCTRAKDLLSTIGEDYIEHNILDEGELEILTSRLGYGPKSVPQIFLDDNLIGGYDELVKSMKW